MKRFIIILCLFLTPMAAHAQLYETFQAEVQEISSENEIVATPLDKPFKKLELSTVNLREEIRTNLEPGDLILVENYKENADDPDQFNPVDIVRNTPIFALTLAFILLAVIVGRKKGAFALLTLAASFFVIFFFTIKQIAAGHNPILITLITATILIPLNFYITHGLKKQTSAAVISTLIAMTISLLLAAFIVNWAQLTGQTSDEAFWLTQNFQQVKNMQGLLIGAVMLGLIGILDDITITQTSIVKTLKESKTPDKEIYKKAMDIGRDHISSVINTLILIYASASLPLFVLLSNDIVQLPNLINLEIIAEELIRMLIASIGLIIAVPISTHIANRMLKQD